MDDVHSSFQHPPLNQRTVNVIHVDPTGLSWAARTHDSASLESVEDFEEMSGSRVEWREFRVVIATEDFAHESFRRNRFYLPAEKGKSRNNDLVSADDRTREVMFA